MNAAQKEGTLELDTPLTEVGFSKKSFCKFLDLLKQNFEYKNMDKCEDSDNNISLFYTATCKTKEVNTIKGILSFIGQNDVTIKEYGLLTCGEWAFEELKKECNIIL